MNRPRRRFLQLATAAVVLSAWWPAAWAQSYPSRPVHWIVSFAAGGANDIVARLMGQFLSEKLGQQFIIEDRGGAGGNIGMAAVLSAAPDGYTIGFAAPNNAINATFYDKLPFDFLRDSVPVAGTMLLTNVMEVHPSVPAGPVAEFITYAKANQGRVYFASSGTGAPAWLCRVCCSKAMTEVDHWCAMPGVIALGPAMADLQRRPACG